MREPNVDLALFCDRYVGSIQVSEIPQCFGNNCKNFKLINYLNQRIVAEGRTAEGRRSAEETRVCDFLDCLANAKYQGGVHE